MGVDFGRASDSVGVAGGRATEDEGADAAGVVDAEPLADATAHGDSVGVRAFDAEVVEDGDGVAGEATSGVSGFAGLVAPAGTTVVEHDDAVAGGEIVADGIPVRVVAALTRNQYERFARAVLFEVEVGAFGACEWHGRKLARRLKAGKGGRGAYSSGERKGERAMARYIKPDFLTARIANPLMTAATRLGLSLRGSRILAVQGRKSGKWRTTPVNPLTLDGERYLVAPRGDTHWVRNIRAAGGGRLTLGRKTEEILVEEVPDEAKVPILRAYLKVWRAETGKFFGVSKEPTDDELARVAGNHPVFRIVRND